jgi:hypothetical protein
MLPSPMTCQRAGRCFRGILQAILAAGLFPALAAAQQNRVPARITQAIDPAHLTVLKGNVHPLARAEFDRGPAPASLQLNRMLLVLQRSPEQEAALEALIDEQQDKSSPNYHAWLTPQQFGQQFGPADQDIQTIVSWLESQGFEIDSVANGRGVIGFSGTADQVQNAFHTEIHSYDVNGNNHWANASDPEIPAALVPVVAGVASLNSFRRRPMYHLAGVFGKSKTTGQVTRIGTLASGTPSPNFTETCGTNSNTGAPISCYALGPYDFATIYNVLPLWNASPAIDGTGQSVAIVARTNINLQDISDFRTLFGLPANPPNVILDGPDPGIVQGDETEADLDVEWSGAVAKGAQIDLVVSQSTETSDGVDLSALYIVDNDLAPVMSESYSECELGLGTAGNQFMSNLWEQAAAEGITAFVSSGDNGAAGCDFYADQTPEPAQYGLEVNGIASTPFNVAVGGTDFNDFSNGATYWNSTNNSTTQASAKGYIPETTWNNSCTNGIFAQLGFSTNAETNCNNSQLSSFVFTLGGGGGNSACTSPSGDTPSSCSGGYGKPSWQVGAGVPSDGKRDLPDVSLFASNGFVGNFYMMCERDKTSGQPCSTSYFLGVGGTSAASPAFAGIMAMVDQKMAAPEGNANYILYKLAAKSGNTCASAANPASACVFYDIPAGSTIAMPCLSDTMSCSPTNSSDLYGVLPGYATTPGYDLATGLGSVNAANLANDWGGVGDTPSTTTLTLNSGNPVNITHGNPVPVSVGVAPNSPEPTGNVSLLALAGGTPTDFGTLALNTSGAASGTFSTLPGGTSYSVKAHYAGDATYAGSDSNAVTVTVSPEASMTSLGIITFDPTSGRITSTNATSFPYGSAYVLRSDVANSSGTLCFNSASRSVAYPCPTGTIALTDNGATLGPGTLVLNSQGYTEYQAIQLPGGSHNLVASYSGDNSYNASSTTDSVTVTPAPTTTSITQTQSQPAVIGSSFWIDTKTTSNSSGVAPTGTYKLFDGTTPLTWGGTIYGTAGSASSGASFTGGLVTTISGPSGPHTISAQYTGDSNYASSTSSGVTVNAVYPDTLTVTASPNTVIYGQNTSVTITATLDTTNPASNAALKPVGAMTFNSSAGPITGTVTTSTGQDASGNWELQATVTTTPQQSESISASFAGDSNYGSVSNQVFINVTVPDFSVSTSSPSLAITAGQTGTVMLTITPATNYTSTVALTCSAPTSFGGSTCTVSPQSVTLSNGAAATATLSITTTSPSSSSTAMLLPIGMRTEPLPPIVPYAWWFAAVLAMSASLLLLSARRRCLRASFAFAVLGLLSFAIGCGGGNGGGGGGGGGGNPIPTTTTISVSGTKVPSSSGVALTATVSPSSATGTALFSSTCGTSASAGLVNGIGQAQLSCLTGTWGVSAAYGGDSGHQNSQSGTLDIAFTGNASVAVQGQTSSDIHPLTINVTLQ